MAKTLKGKLLGGGDHRWIGYPQFCAYCNAPNFLDYAIARGWYDTYLDEWDTDAHRAEYQRSVYCPVVPFDVDPYELPFPLRESDYGEEE